MRQQETKQECPYGNCECLLRDGPVCMNPKLAGNLKHTGGFICWQAVKTSPAESRPITCPQCGWAGTERDVILTAPLGHGHRENLHSWCPVCEHATEPHYLPESVRLTNKNWAKKGE